MSSDEITDNISWNPTLETYFKETGEKAHGLAWLHKKAEDKFTRLKTPLELSTIIIGTINGFVSVGSEQIFHGFPYSSIIIGIISLFVSILNTVSSYYAYGKRTEGHRIASLQYSKLNRYIAVECGLPRSERVAPAALLKYTKDTYDRLSEIAPLVPQDIITLFKSEFKQYTRVKRPSETNGLEEITVYSNGATDRPYSIGEQAKGPPPPETPLQVAPETPDDMLYSGEDRKR
jgi:hypothetical protein